MADDLFSGTAQAELSNGGPLAERVRPTGFQEVAGQSKLAGEDGTLRRLVGAKRLPSLIFWGPAGSGKTTLARIVATQRGDRAVELSATSATVADLRREVESATQRLGQYQQRTLVFLDEIHRFNKAQQDALLPAVESGLISLIGATTESPWATINGPLLSRCTVLRLDPLDDAALESVVRRGADHDGIRVDDSAVELLVGSVDGDARKALTILEMAAALAVPDTVLGVAEVRRALGAGDVRYGTGAHYDAASAFIKWMRRSDPAQALAWLVHMLEGGEDPRFVARRMSIFASEDIGHADPRAMLIADAAARAVQTVGMPEARYLLAQACGYLARAPKSRAVCDDLALGESTERRLPPEMLGEDS